MRGWGKSSWIVVGALLVASGDAEKASAYFERQLTSARVVAVGGAFVALADDPTAAAINAAGLTQLSDPGVLAAYTRPYGLSDVDAHLIAAVWPLKRFGLGVAWHRTRLDDALTEDLLSLSAGWDLIRTSQDASLSFGLGMDVARVAVDGTYDDARTRLGGAAGVLLRPFPIIGLGYVVKHIGEPTFDFVAGGGRTRLESEHAFGVAYHWQRRAVVTYETRREQDGRWQQRVGVEVVVRPEFQFRAGLLRGDVTGGVGIRVSGVVLDVGVEAHDVLGVSYVVSIGYTLPGAQEEWQ